MDRNQIINKLDLIKKSTSEVPEILKNFCIKDGEALAYNGVQAARVNVDVGSNFCVDGAMLLSLMKSYNTPEIDLELVSSVLKVKAGRSSKLQLSTMSPDDFPHEFEEEEIVSTIELTGEFVKGLSGCLNSVTDSYSHIVESGVILDITDGMLRLFSTNSTSISSFVDSREINCENGEFLMPKLFCEMVINWFNVFKKEDINLTILKCIDSNEYSVEVHYGDIGSLKTSITDFREDEDPDNPIDFQETIDANTTENLCDVSDLFKEIVNRSFLIKAHDGVKDITLKIADDKITFNTVSQGYGMLEDDMAIPEVVGVVEDYIEVDDFPEGEFMMSCLLLKRALKIVEKFSIVKRGEEYLFYGEAGGFKHLISAVE